MRRILTRDFQTGFVGRHLWKGLDGLRFEDLNDNSKRLFATPDEGLDR